VTKTCLMIAAAICVASASPAIASTVAPAPTPKTAAPAPAQPPAQTITRSELTKELDATFKAVDTNGDGVLSQSELAAAESKGIQNRVAALRSRMDAEFDTLDTNHDGQLSKAEFMVAAPQAPTTAPDGADALAQFDKNHDAKVTMDEFRASRLAMFDKLDTNHDGTISATERQAAQAQTTPRRRR
jgi:Ca2+-binding EF-hand superfamily protein